MSMCMSMCMSMYVHVHVYVCLCVCLYMSMCTSIYVYVHVYVCLCVYLCMSIYVYMYVYVHVYVCLCVCLYMSMCMSMCISMYVYVYVYICLCMSIYVYVLPIVILSVQYAGFHDGVQFVKREVTFTLGEGCEDGVISGLEYPSRKMRKGERCRLTISPRYAYGQKGCPSLGVPSNATLVYEVEMVAFVKVQPVLSLPYNVCVLLEVYGV